MYFYFVDCLYISEDNCFRHMYIIQTYKCLSFIITVIEWSCVITSHPLPVATTLHPSSLLWAIFKPKWFSSIKCRCTIPLLPITMFSDFLWNQIKTQQHTQTGDHSTRLPYHLAVRCLLELFCTRLKPGTINHIDRYAVENQFRAFHPHVTPYIATNLLCFLIDYYQYIVDFQITEELRIASECLTIFGDVSQ